MQCHTVLIAKTFNKCLQYFVIECRIVGFAKIVWDLVASQNSKILFPRKWKTKLGTFNITLKLNSNDYKCLRKLSSCTYH